MSSTPARIQLSCLRRCLWCKTTVQMMSLWLTLVKREQQAGNLLSQRGATHWCCSTQQRADWQTACITDVELRHILFRSPCPCAFSDHGPVHSYTHFSARTRPHQRKTTSIVVDIIWPRKRPANLHSWAFVASGISSVYYICYIHWELERGLIWGYRQVGPCKLDWRERFRNGT
jgi:hypothetical protein